MLLSITKLQNLKAIHNRTSRHKSKGHVVVNHKTTKFESNSQRAMTGGKSWKRCCQSQNYKIWKQFTTCRGAFGYNKRLLSITKLQNLKAIHNGITHSNIAYVVVVNHKTTKFESNSQQSHQLPTGCRGCCQSQNYKIWKQFTTRWRCCVLGKKVVVNHKTTKFESNSQRGRRVRVLLHRCCQSQNYKIWKQFTTECAGKTSLP